MSTSSSPKPEAEAEDLDATIADENGASQQQSFDAATAKMVAQFTQKREEKEVDRLFRALVKLEGSDLHLKVGKPPIVRVNGTLKPLNRGPIEIEEMARLLFPMMNERNRKIFEDCLLYTSPSPRDQRGSRMPSSA